MGKKCLLLAAGVFFLLSLRSGRGQEISPASFWFFSKFRPSVSLDGGWQFRPKKGKNWREIRIPAPFLHSGEYLFRRSFTVPREWAGRQFLLVFEGIGYGCLVKLNGQFLASRPYGGPPLLIRIPAGILRPGQANRLEVELSTRLSAKSIPLERALFQPEIIRGIYRSVTLYALPPVAVTDVKVSLLEIFKENVKLAVQIQVVAGEGISTGRNVRDIFRLRLDVYHPQMPTLRIARVEKMITLSEEGVYSFQDTLVLQNPQWWEPKARRFYPFRVSLQSATGLSKLLDAWNGRFALRHIHLENGRLYWNAEPVVLRGATFVEDSLHWLDSRSIVPYLNHYRELGLNLVSWFYPPPMRSLAQADSMGLLQIVRLPVWNVPARVLKNEEYQRAAAGIVRELVQTVSVFPSVIAIDLGEGYDIQVPESVRFIRAMRQALADHPGILVTAGIRNQSSMAIELPLDFLTINLTYRWLLHWDWWISEWVVSHPDLPLLIGDVYAPFIPFRRDAENLSRFEVQQAYYLKTAIQRILERPTLGYVLSSLYDFRCVYPSTMAYYSGSPRFLPFGLADARGETRMAWNVLRDLNRNQGVQFEFQEIQPEAGEQLFLFWGFAFLIVFLYYFRRDHRLRGNIVRILVRPFGFRIELKERRKVPQFHTYLLLINISTVLGMTVASVAYYLRRHPVFDFFLAEIAPTETVNRWFISMSWNPILGIAGATLFFGVAFFLFGLYVHILSVVLRQRLLFRNSMALVIWESSVFLFLYPVALVLVRMVGIAALRIPLAFLFGLFVLWFIYRVWRGVRTVFGRSSPWAPVLTFLLPAVIIGAALLVLDHQRALLAQLEYLRHIWKIRL